MAHTYMVVPLFFRAAEYYFHSPHVVGPKTEWQSDFRYDGCICYLSTNVLK